jgi:hypothetical protein
VHCNFDTDVGQFSYSLDGREFKPMGGEIKLPFQLRTFQGVRYALFHYNTGANPGGHADFDDFLVSEPRPRGLTKPIPYGQRIAFSSLANGNALTIDRAAAFRILDRGRGRVALQAPSGAYVSVAGTGKAGEIALKPGKPGDAETFQWVDLQRGDTLLLSLATHRYLVLLPDANTVSADHTGPTPDRKDGSCFQWRIVR